MRDKVKVRTLRPYEKIKLRRLKQQKRHAVNSRHARIILLAVGGMANRGIAASTDCSVQWVRQVIHRFNDDGIGGITWLPWFQVQAAIESYLTWRNGHRDLSLTVWSDFKKANAKAA